MKDTLTSPQAKAQYAALLAVWGAVLSGQMPWQVGAVSSAQGLIALLIHGFTAQPAVTAQKEVTITAPPKV